MPSLADEEDSIFLEDSDNDNENDSDSYNSSESSDEHPPISYYFMERTFWKQHMVAIGVAILASMLAYVSMNSQESVIATLTPRTNTQTRTAPRTPTIHSLPTNAPPSPSHRTYRRTNNLNLCPFDFDIIGTTTDLNRDTRIRTILLDNDKTAFVDTQLHMFEFNLPKEHIGLMAQYMLADEQFDDAYVQLYATWSIDNDTPIPTSASSHGTNYDCLLQAGMKTNQRSTVPITTVRYHPPPFPSYYQQRTLPNIGISLTTKKSKTLQPAKLSHTDFSAKFINLSTKSVHLYWDHKHTPVLIGVIPPFEAFGTATSPGGSFFFTPTYDSRHALKRWTLTADDAVVYYDAIGSEIDSLSVAEEAKYAMHRVNQVYGREYLAVTQRIWLSMFPNPMPVYIMWEAGYFDQLHNITSTQGYVPDLSLNDQDKERLFERVKWNDDDTTQPHPFFQDISISSQEFQWKVISVTPRVLEMDDFLNDMELNHIMELTARYPANPKTNTTNPSKSNSTSPQTQAWLHREFSPIMDLLYRRVADLLQINERILREHTHNSQTDIQTHHSIAEPFQIQQYVPSQQSPPHHDYLYPSISNRYQPSRFASLMVFLNDVEEGGEMVFPCAKQVESHEGVVIVPKKGKAVLVYDMLPDGNMDDWSQHGSNVVMKGEMWIGNLWVWNPIID